MTRLTVEADGASRGNPGPSAAGVVILDGAGAIVAELSRYLGDHLTNNVAEWSAALAGIEEARRLGATALRIRMDAQLVVKHLRGFEKVETEHVPRKLNARADALANAALERT